MAFTDSIKNYKDYLQCINNWDSYSVQEQQALRKWYRDYYSQNKETERLRYRSYYALNSEAERERVKKYKKTIESKLNYF